MSPPPPRQIGPYRIGAELGHGGMAVVYEAAPLAGGPAVALKVALRPSPELHARLRQEVAALRGVEHPGVVRYRDHGVVDGRPWYAMELVEGVSLRRWALGVWGDQPERPPSASTLSLGDLAEETGRAPGGEDPPTPAAPVGPLPKVANGRLVEVLTVVRRLCAPLVALHARGLVHRDLKPENVIVRPNGFPVVMDLGLVLRGGLDRARLSAEGVTLGTLAYMAPEQSEGLPVDARADLYSLGSILYELLSGRTPLQAADTLEWLHAIRATEPAPLDTRVEGAPPELGRLLARLLAKDPSRRPGFAEEVAEVLLAAGARDEPLDLGSHGRDYLCRARLVGREVPLERAADALAALPRRGSLLTLVARSGMGKSALLNEIARLAVRRRQLVLTLGCLPLGGAGLGTLTELRGAPFAPLRQLFERVEDIARGEGPPAAQRLLGAHPSLLVEVWPGFATVPGVGPLPQEDLPPEVRADRTREAIWAMVGELARVRGPLVLVLDDLQWADDATLGFLQALPPGWPDQVPLVLLLSWRLEESTAPLDALAARTEARTLPLGPLPPAAIAEMVRQMLAIPDAPEALLRRVIERASGMPLHVVEALRLALSEGALHRTQQGWMVREPGASQERSDLWTMEALLARRLAAVRVEDRPVLHAAAVLGRSLSVSLIAAVAGCDEDTTGAALGRLRELGIVEEVDGGLRFAHDKLLEAARGLLAPESRTALHRSAAEAIDAQRVTGASYDPVEIAEHWRQAGEPARAVDAYEIAGVRAVRAYAIRDTEDVYARILELSARVATPFPRERVARWHHALAEVARARGHFPSLLARAGTALEQLERPMPASAGAWGWSILRDVFRRYVPERSVRPEADSEAALLYIRVLDPLLFGGDFPAALGAGMRALNLAEASGARATLCRALAQMSALLVLTPLRGVADRWWNRARAMVDTLQDADAELYTRHRGGAYLVARGRWGPAEEFLEAALTRAREVGARRSETEVRIMYAGVYLYSGRYERGAELAQGAQRLADDTGDAQLGLWATVNVLLARTFLGERAELPPLIAEVRRRLVDEEDATVPTVWGPLVLAHLALGETSTGVALGRRLAARLTALPGGPFWYHFGLAASAEAALAAGDVAFLAEASENLGKFARMNEFLAPSARLYQGHLAWRRGKQGAALRAWKRGLAEAVRFSMPREELELHRALATHGAPEGRAGHEAEVARLRALVPISLP